MLEKGLHNAFRAQIRHGTLHLSYPSGQTGIYGDGGAPVVAVRIADSTTLRKIALDPGLAGPEAYMEGRLILEAGDVYDLVVLAKRNIRVEATTPWARLQHYRRRLFRAPLRTIGLARARANVAHHYDLDERLYRLFLDDDMQYSCAWFEHSDQTLEQAQMAKKRLIAAKMLIRPGARVLDIGSGWGGMALYLARVCDADVTGITLSSEQLRVSTERAEAAGLSDRVRFRLQDYRQVTETFDNIVSVGMFEHVGLRQYPVFFETAARLLARDGVMLLHSMAQTKPALYNQPFIDKYIFPGGYIPALSEVMPPLEQSGLLMRDTEILSLHYAETTREWRRRFHANHAAVRDLYDGRFIRMWDFYLAASEATFRAEALHVFHLQLAHDQTRVPLTRAYIDEAMERLRAAEARVPEYAALHGPPAPIARSVGG